MSAAIAGVREASERRHLLAPGARPLIHRFRTADALADAVVGVVASAVVQGIGERNTASLVFSGGSTPALFLFQIATLDLPWSQVTVTLADERWVAPDDELSNERMLRQLLLRDRAASAHFFPLKNTSASADEGVHVSRALLAAIAHPYDLVLLGMGNDGHFASLFPGSAALHEGLDPVSTARCIAVPTPSSALPAVPRISMTLAEIRSSQRTILIIQGQSKLDLLETAYHLADPYRYPVCALGAVEVFWCP
jgi:6-phosphogluconolactonase